VTEDRLEAEQQANLNVVVGHAAQHAARLAKGGNYEQAQLEARAAQRFLSRAGVNEGQLVTFSENIESMDNVLRAQRKREKLEPANIDRKNRDDETAAVISKATKINTKKVI